MRKMIALLLAVLMVSSFTTSAFASEVTDESDMQSAYSEIVYDLSTSYCIYIPEQIDATVGSYTFTASYLNLDETEQVVVRMSGVDDLSHINLYNDAEDALSFNVIYDYGGIAPNYIVAIFTDSVTADGTMQLIPDTYGTVHQPGRYSGGFEFTVSVESRA